MEKQCNAWHVLRLYNVRSPQKKLGGLKKATDLATTIVCSASECGNDPLLKDFNSSTKTSLQVGEVRNVSCLKELENLLASSKIVYYSDGAGAKKVKIVVTKEQFKLLLANAKKLQSRHRLLSYTGPRKGCKNWRPTLSAISEEEDF